MSTEEIRITDPLTGGQKGMKPARYGLIPAFPLDEIAKVYGYGAGKYAPNNWRKGYSWTLSLDALGRHIAQFRKGESIDPESNLHHLAHAAFHLLTLMEWERLGTPIDDRGDVQNAKSIRQQEIPVPGADGPQIPFLSAFRILTGVDGTSSLENKAKREEGLADSAGQTNNPPLRGRLDYYDGSD